MLSLEHLALLYQQHTPACAAKVREFSLGAGVIPFNARPAIMGVINLSPDSWYRESVCLTTDRAVERGVLLAAQGAEVVDLGAESTLAQAARADQALQNSRLLPVIRELRHRKICVSAETYDPAVSEAALAAGATVLNLTGLKHAPEIYRMAAAHGAAVIICYVQGQNVREVSDFRSAGDPIADMHDYFGRELERATAAGLERILLDPGLGFYYRNLQDGRTRVCLQMEVFLNTFRLRTLGFPICHALPHAFEYFGEEVRTAEPFFAVLAALGQASLFRTHEVAKVRAVLETLAIYGSHPASRAESGPTPTGV